MQHGLAFVATDQTLDPAPFGRTATGRDLGSSWLPRYPHIPTSRRPPQGGVVGASPLPDRSVRTSGPIVPGAGADPRTIDELDTPAGLVREPGR